MWSAIQRNPIINVGLLLVRKLVNKATRLAREWANLEARVACCSFCYIFHVDIRWTWVGQYFLAGASGGNALF